METHSKTRFSETPPGSPKSCLKGNRKLNFEEESTTSSSSSTHQHHHHHHHSKKPTVAISHQTDVPPSSPSTKRSPKVMIKSPGSERSTTTTSTGVGTQCSEVPFQFQLTQHYDNPPPPPNCTSNTAYEEERLKKLNQSSNSSTPVSPVASSEQTIVSETTTDNSKNSGSLHNNHSEKLQSYDPQLVAIASKVVTEIIQKATQEVASRQQKVSEIKRGSTASSSAGERHRDFFGLGRTPWYRRAHGVISKWVTNICVRAQNAMKT